MFFPTYRFIHRHGWMIVPIRQHPGFAAASFSALLQDGLHQAFSNSLIVMSGCHPDLIDPEFRGRFVRVDIDDRADKTYDQSIIERHYDPVARVIYKFFRRCLDNWIVKDIFGDIVEDIRICCPEEFDFNHTLPFYILVRRYPESPPLSRPNSDPGR